MVLKCNALREEGSKLYEYRGCGVEVGVRVRVGVGRNRLFPRGWNQSWNQYNQPTLTDIEQTLLPIHRCRYARDPLPAEGGGGATPMSFLKWPPKRSADQAEILRS